MSGSDSSSKLEESSSQTDLTWIERARRMVAYYPEASAFIRRASQHFPVNSDHTQLLLHLWVEIEALDGQILPALRELNDRLLKKRGVLDTTRGVSSRQSVLLELNGDEADEVVFDFTWSLSWAEDLRVAVILSSNDSGVIHVQAHGANSGIEHRIGYPVAQRALEEALTTVYVAEETSK